MNQLHVIANELVVSRIWSRDYDCWALVREIYDRAYGIALPVVLLRDPAEVELARPALAEEARSTRWVRIEVPKEGDVVAMGLRRDPHHCGVWLAVDGGRILHNCQPPLGMGVTLSPVQVLRRRGWACFRYYRHQDRA